MKRTIFVLALLVMIISIGFGQMAFKQGDRVLSAGLGLGTFAGVHGDASMPPISIGYEVGYNENISFGGLAGIAGSKQKYVGFGGTWG